MRDADQARRADAEAALLTALDHPHLVRLHAVVPADGASVLVLDLADGGSLAELLAARGRLTPGEVITAVAPVAAALAYLHDQGVVHGDVSAANILFTAGGSPLLADVGVARLTGDDRDAASTPAYVDPAVAAGCVPGPPSDVFMLGGGGPARPHRRAAVGRRQRRRPRSPWPPRACSNDVAERLLGGRRPGGDGGGAGPGAGRRSASPRDRRRPGPRPAAQRRAGRRRAGGRARTRVARRAAPPPPGPRHAAQPAGARRTSAGPGCRPTSAPGRRSSGRPASPPPAAGASPPTRLVGPRPRPAIPRSRPRGRRRRAVLLALALALRRLAGRRRHGVGHDRRPPGPQPVRRPAPGRRREPPAVQPGSRRPPAPPRRPGHSAGRAGSDYGRARPRGDERLARGPARPRRDPGPGLPHPRRAPARPRLPARPAARRRHRDPAPHRPGRLRTVRGAHHLSRRAGARHGEHLTVTATATLSASRLICAGRVTGTAPGTGPVRLRVILAPTASGLRIAELHS